MKITVRGKNITITEGIESKINQKLAKLDKYFYDAEQLEAKVLVRVYPRGQKIEVTIPAGNLLLRAEVVEDDLYAAIDEVVDNYFKSINDYNLDFNYDSKEVRTTKGNYIGKSIIIAAGAKNRKLNLNNI